MAADADDGDASDATATYIVNQAVTDPSGAT
jgi:hypothetical protein